MNEAKYEEGDTVSFIIDGNDEFATGIIKYVYTIETIGEPNQYTYQVDAHWGYLMVDERAIVKFDLTELLSI